MRIRIQVVIEAENGHEETIEEVGCLERGALRPEELGLTLCEAKTIAPRSAANGCHRAGATVPGAMRGLFSLWPTSIQKRHT
jgi:hypothetical protein